MDAKEKRMQLLPFIWTPDEDTRLNNIDKLTFKVCEAVALGLSHYYMGKNDRRKVTEEERAAAKRIIPMLPERWMVGADKLPWSCLNKKKGE